MKKRKKAASPPAKGRRSQPPRARSNPGTGGRSGSFVLAGECTVAGVAALKAGLGRLVREPRSVALDIAGLERIDTAGVQVIAAFLRDRRERGLGVTWLGTSATLSPAVQLLGLASLFGLSA